MGARIKVLRRVRSTGSGGADYHTAQRFSGGQTIFAPGLHAKACWNSGRLTSVPKTRKRPGGCESFCASWRSVSGRRASARA